MKKIRITLDLAVGNDADLDDFVQCVVDLINDDPLDDLPVISYVDGAQWEPVSLITVYRCPNGHHSGTENLLDVPQCPTCHRSLVPAAQVER